MSKEALRNIYLQKRISLSDTEYEQLSHSLCQNFFENIDLSSTKILHAFLPLRKYKEPDTWLIINRITADFPYIRIALPRVDEQTQKLENYFFESLDQLKVNKWGISEPKYGTLVNAIDIDMILVPLLAFDRSGNRVGYGKGFYDKFLPQCRSSCYRVGISLFPPTENKIDTDIYDQALTKAITPDDIFDFQ